MDGLESFHKKYKKIKKYDAFDPKSINSCVSTYFSSHLYEYSIYSYFYNLNTFLSDPHDKYENIIPFRDKNLSIIIQDKDLSDFFYENKDAFKYTHIALSKFSDKSFIDYFIEVTFPNIFGNFISDDLCDKAYNFLDGFYDPLPNKSSIKNELSIGLLSKFIRSDMNFQFSFFDSFNSLYSNGSKYNHTLFVECLQQAAVYSFSLLNNQRISALKKLISENKNQILVKVISDIIKKVIRTWKYDSYYICYNDQNFDTLNQQELDKISKPVIDALKDDREYQPSKIGLLFTDRNALPIIITCLDLIIIDQIFIVAQIQPILCQNQADLVFNLSKAYNFTVKYRAFPEQAKKFIYNFNDKETATSPKKLNYYKFRLECISKSLDPIEEQKKIRNELINKIKANKNWPESRQKNEIEQVKNNYNFFLCLEIKICENHHNFQSNFNGYPNRVFKSNMMGLMRYMSQIIHKICYFSIIYLKKNLKIKENNFIQIVKNVTNEEMKKLLLSITPNHDFLKFINLNDITKDFTDFTTDDFFLFIQNLLFNQSNQTDLSNIVPFDTLKTNRPLMYILTELQKSLFYLLEREFHFDEQNNSNEDLKTLGKADVNDLPNSCFISLLIDNIQKSDKRALILTFIEIYQYIKECSNEKGFKSFIIKYFPDKASQVIRCYNNSKKYYEMIQKQIPNNLNDIFSNV